MAAPRVCVATYVGPRSASSICTRNVRDAHHELYRVGECRRGYSELTLVSERIRDGLFHCKLVASRVDADLVLKEWSKLVMTKFKVDNLPLPARTDTPEGVAHITGELTMLNSPVALWQSESAARMKELVDKLDASNSEVAQLRMQVTSLKSLFSTREMKSPVRCLKSPVVRKSPSDVGDSDVAGEVQGASAAAATNLNAFCDSEIDVGDTAGDSASATAQSSAQSGHRFSVQAGILGMGGAAPRPVLSVNALAFSGDSTPNYSLDNKKAIEFYEDSRLAFPRMSKQDEARGRVCVRLFKGRATEEEKTR